MARWEAVVAAGIVTFTLVAGDANTAEAACGGPGANYPAMGTLASSRATDEVIPGTRGTRSLGRTEIIDEPAKKAAPKGKALPVPTPKLKIVRVAGVRDSFNIVRTYGTEGARCGGVVTTDVSFQIFEADLQTAYEQNADYVIIDFGGGTGANCPAFADAKEPPHFTARKRRGDQLAIVWNHGAPESGQGGIPKDQVSFVRLGDARAIQQAGCLALALRK